MMKIGLCRQRGSLWRLIFIYPKLWGKRINNMQMASRKN